MIRFTRDLMLGIALMTVGYTLQRIGRWLRVKPRDRGSVYTVPPRPVVVYMYPNDTIDPNTGWLENSPELLEWLGRKMPEKGEWN